IVSARTSPRSMSDNPFVGSSNNPREAGFSEMAIEFSEKSRRRRSSMIVDQRSSGRVPGKQHFDVPQLLVFREDFRSAFFQFPRNLRWIPFHREVQVAQ